MVSLLCDFASVMTSIGYIFIALMLLMVMITIHELGHYVFGKMLGFKINEFAIGFGKAIFKKTLKSGEIFSIRILPLGGYCAFAGEDQDDPDPNAFNNKKPWRRLIVQFGGVFFNFISAILFSFILLVSFGYDIPRVQQVDDYCVEQAQIAGKDMVMVGDVIREVDGVAVDFCTGNTFTKLIDGYNIGDEFTLTVQRNVDGVIQSITLDVTKYADPDDATNQAGLLGIENYTAYQYTFIEALLKCIPLTLAFAWQILVFLFNLFTGQLAFTDMGGPITTVATIAEFSQMNIANLFIFLPFISVNLALFNLLPLPALDGSRMVFTTIEWIRGKPINRNVEGMIHLIGLFVLFGFVIFVDLFNIFS